MTTPETAELPDRIAIFPLPGVLLLPGAQLPLNIFEPRYLDMTRDALAGHGLIAMVQPLDPADPAREPETYDTACAGRITQHRETDDGRILITLTGVARFAIAEEFDRVTLYRQVAPDWRAFPQDLTPDDEDAVDRARFLPALKLFAARFALPLDWEAVEALPSPVLVNQVAMVCPFAPSEKQALLEARDIGERSRLMTALMEMAALQGQNSEPPGGTAH